jgi:menaquinone-dependent protoporphyrinogen oxidase
MKTLILYGTQYGYTADCAGQLTNLLEGETTLVDLTRQSTPDLAGYDAVIIGGSIYMGKIQERVSGYCAAHAGELLQKRLGLFLCCGMPENLQQSLEASFPEALREKAAAIGCFGGELRTGRMKPVHRLIAKMMEKATAKDGIKPPEANPQAVKDFARAMAVAL